MDEKPIIQKEPEWIDCGDLSRADMPAKIVKELSDYQGGQY